MQQVTYAGSYQCALLCAWRQVDVRADANEAEILFEVCFECIASNALCNGPCRLPSGEVRNE